MEPLIIIAAIQNKSALACGMWMDSITGWVGLISANENWLDSVWHLISLKLLHRDPQTVRSVLLSKCTIFVAEAAPTVLCASVDGDNTLMKLNEWKQPSKKLGGRRQRPGAQVSLLNIRSPPSGPQTLTAYEEASGAGRTHQNEYNLMRKWEVSTQPAALRSLFPFGRKAQTKSNSSSE